MKIEDMKNYGRPMNESMRDIPEVVMKRIKSTAFTILRRRLGLLKLLRFMILFMCEKKRMSRVDLSPVREKGLEDEEFIKEIIDRTAVFSALSKVLTKEEALDINYGITEEVATEMMSCMMPTEDEFLAFDDPLFAAKKYIFALMEADKRVGLHDSVVAEDKADAFQVNVTYCAFCEIPRLLGIVEAALPSCYGDDVFFPAVCENIGLRFVRKGTLARGNEFCDFRFERVK
jgi:hypothetical protein